MMRKIEGAGAKKVTQKGKERKKKRPIQKILKGRRVQGKRVGKKVEERAGLAGEPGNLSTLLSFLLLSPSRMSPVEATPNHGSDSITEMRGREAT